MIIAPIFYILAHILFPLNTSSAIVPKLNQGLTDNDFKYIYLSFDDGPMAGTSNCVDICLNQKVNATFFEVGLHQSKTNSAKLQYTRIAQNESLFDIGNHSYTHANSLYKYFYHHPNMAFDDFMKAHRALQIKNNISRLPGNNAWNTLQAKRASGLVRPLVQKLDSAGFNIIGWDLEWHFNKKGRPIQTAQNMADLVDTLFEHNQTMSKNHLVILMHDHMFRSSEDSAKLANMIGLLKQNPKYHFRKLTQYPFLKTE